MEGGGGSSRSSSSCLMMAFGDNNNSMMMMPPITTSTNNPSSDNNNTLSWNLCNASQFGHQDLTNNHHHGSSSSMMIEEPHHHHNDNNTITTTGCYFMEDTNNNCSRDTSLKAKIMAHPHYRRLLAAYVNCQKIGAPPEVVARLEEACGAAVSMGNENGSRSCVGEDPCLDQFMEAYCEMLMKYEQELSKPLNEAMMFLSRIEYQFKALTLTSHSATGVEQMDRNASSEEEVDVNNSTIDPLAEDRELKGQLLRKYSGYLGSLKQEFMKKRKKGKLPKEARQLLLDWWSRHYKWPYPSESQKLALAEATGLDQKQINNWFINQRKRHWKPSEDLQFVVMDAAHPTYYMDNNLMANPFQMDVSPALL